MAEASRAKGEWWLVADQRMRGEVREEEPRFKAELADQAQRERKRVELWPSTSTSTTRPVQAP